jgi:endonuclease/exonuclease/phosphatase family metal-dependent hydrolase
MWSWSSPAHPDVTPGAARLERRDERMSAYPQIRVGTWNLWWRFGVWDRRHCTIARVLERVDADVVGLQEVWSTERDNQAEALATKLDMHFVWAPSPRPERWQERIADGSVGVGTAILSRWPLVDHGVRALPGADIPALHAVVDTPSGGLPIFTVHLDSAPGASSLRCRQVAALAALIAETGEGDLPAVITGDFNAEPDSDEIRLLEGHKTAPAVPGQVFVDAWRFAEAGSPAATWDSRNPHAAALGFPDSRIDYVFVGMPISGRGRVLGVRRFGAAAVDGVWPSDHFGVLAHIAAC